MKLDHNKKWAPVSIQSNIFQYGLHWHNEQHKKEENTKNLGVSKLESSFPLVQFQLLAVFLAGTVESYLAYSFNLHCSIKLPPLASLRSAQVSKVIEPWQHAG